jgi:predicted regulator of Ras-like GTPase activity (Roadblock/LC7/MglB family)
MATLTETLQKIVHNTPGATGAILMGFDGIAVMQYMADDSDIDVESAGMEFSFRFIELRRAAQSLNMGEVSDITVKTDRQAILCRVLSEEYFVAVLMRDSAHMGKGRWVLRTSASELMGQL